MLPGAKVASESGGKGKGMKTWKWHLLLTAMLAALAAGCSDDVNEDELQGAYAGTWRGTACGRGLTLMLDQNGLDLSGTYELTEPTFTETLQGSVSSLYTPATATLTALDGRKFEITFTSHNSLVGIFYNPGPECNVSATK